MSFDFVPLSTIPAAQWTALLNDPGVHRHMPLAGADRWDETKAADWAAGKDRQWTENGYGPWAILVDGTFAGWGGFQKEGVDADLGLVLLPAFWGLGRALHGALLNKGFGELGLQNITILLPPSRPRLKSLLRAGYRADGEVGIGGARFLRFRLDRPIAPPDPLP